VGATQVSSAPITGPGATPASPGDQDPLQTVVTRSPAGRRPKLPVRRAGPQSRAATTKTRSGISSKNGPS